MNNEGIVKIRASDFRSIENNTVNTNDTRKKCQLHHLAPETYAKCIWVRDFAKGILRLGDSQCALRTLAV